MIWSNNTKVFSIRYTHAYFNNEPTSFLKFFPSPNTKQLMDRYGILINTMTDGFDLYANTSQALDEYLKYVQNATQVDSFDFDIQTEDPLFYNYTALPIDWQGVFEFSSERSQYDAQLNIFMLEEQLSPPQETNTTATLSINFTDIINAISDYSEANYKISFAVRQTQWRYYIINNSNLSFEYFKIDSGDHAIFEPGIKETLSNNQEATMFSSGANRLALSKFPDHNYNLVGINAVNGSAQQQASTILFKGLPTANPSSFNLITVNEETVVVSPMYIYI